mgnify:CR=1 FL=1
MFLKVVIYHVFIAVRERSLTKNRCEFNKKFIDLYVDLNNLKKVTITFYGSGELTTAFEEIKDIVKHLKRKNKFNNISFNKLDTYTREKRMDIKKCRYF